ncbi:Cof-type HAD-IIB family hydrolase [Lacticaseibacillus mingshuiensis]|uniref:Cof-type HAD-IIB family hydrolase n=1 Tax=Lacticaseibacillus mingshuiensis TaxID=2799574 RepID=A0ABW4CJ24_9LACO|nr:Cof-type HAD-IIB family hydrolase [Lacticaseibacillus mingshuiensis]
MQRKLIALDLDGTTLNAKGALTPRTIAVLEAASTAGHQVVITTGRPDSISEPFYDQLHLTAPMINFNGALIHVPHQHWVGEHAVTLPIATALGLQEFKADYDIKVMVAEGKQLLVADHGYTDIPFLPDMPTPTRLFDAAGLTQNPISVTMFIDEATLGPLSAAIAGRFPDLAAKTWGAWSGENTALEVTAPNTSKSRALAYVADACGIARTDIWAFGDDLNDLDMIEFAGMGVAMANARPQILAAADDVTGDDNDHDGVAAYLAKALHLAA